MLQSTAKITSSSKPYIDGPEWYNKSLALINPDKRVRVYRNLTRRALSVKQGVVRFHTQYIFLRDIKFEVNERVRDRVRLRRQKEVHAYVSGFLCPLSEEPVDGALSVRYNPYETDFFTTEHGQPVFTADFADLDCGKSVDINAWNPK